ncbi:FAD-dependent monooxygenase [Nocardia yamanashiensis]|uniref:FAD-dependent monooxygenase n=1 Tax=Nocardia yamanashiensis TaxID=209247 RepID=UPI00082EF3CD|nr:FAD-dependent monooxygenase [Nocardia yamanashiensis]
MKNERILVAGAGIAGLTLAYWLARDGFRPTVVERAASIRTGGQGVDIRDEAVDIVERMGLLSEIRAAATDVAGMRFVDNTDAELARIDMQAVRDKYDSTEVEIMRGDLVRLLHEATSAAVEFRFGDSITALGQDADGVTVTFENSPPERFDLVVGAEGLHSSVRRLAFGPENEFVHFLGHYFAFGNADAALGPDRWVTMHNPQPGSMAGIYRSGAHPQAKAYFMFRSPEREYDHRDRESARQLLQEHFGVESGWQVKELLAGALDDPELYFDALAQVRMDAWSKGRIVLVGDAAYCASPVSGAGAELAIVGAYRLAAELAAAAGDFASAFLRYERSHRPLVARKHRIGPNLRLMVPKTRLGMSVRNIIARLPIVERLAAVERLLAVRKPPGDQSFAPLSTPFRRKTD